MTRLFCLSTAIASALLSGFAWAGDTTVPLPEPGTFELLALAGVVAAVVAVRNWRKK